MGEFTRFDSSDHIGVFGVVMEDVVDDLVVILETKLAVRTGVWLSAAHGSISPQRTGREQDRWSHRRRPVIGNLRCVS